MNLMFSAQSLLKRWYRHGPRFQYYLKQLNHTASFSPEALRQYNNQRLQRIVLHCYTHVPYYQDLFRSLRLSPADIQTSDDLKKLPFLDKHTLNQNYDRMQAKKYLNRFCQKGVTSGSSGTPTRLVRDFNAINFENAACWRYWHKMGHHNEKRLSLRGGIIVPVTQTKPPFWRYSFERRELQMSSFNLSMANSQAYIDKTLEFQPEILCCLPSSGILFARFFKHHGVEYQFKGIFTSSEMVDDSIRNTFEDIFQAPVYDWYGQAERVMAISQCKEGYYHIEEDYAIAELIPSSVGEGFELVGTQLDNYVMPLLRYRTGDYVAGIVEDDTHSPCACGSAFRRVSHILGRSAKDFLVTPEGQQITITTHIPYQVDNLIETQFYQDKVGEVVVNIVTNGSFTEKDKNKLVENTRKYTSPQMKVIVREVPHIPRGPNGKFVSVINQLN